MFFDRRSTCARSMTCSPRAVRHIKPDYEFADILRVLLSLIGNETKSCADNPMLRHSSSCYRCQMNLELTVESSIRPTHGLPHSVRPNTQSLFPPLPAGSLTAETLPLSLLLRISGDLQRVFLLLHLPDLCKHDLAKYRTLGCLRQRTLLTGRLA